MKKIIGIILVSIFSVIVYAQIANAYDNDHDRDDHSHKHPITFPISSPITSALTITGNVTYHSIGREFGKWWTKFWHITPAKGVTVTAKAFTNNTTVQTTTDANGHYILVIPQKGLYRVNAHDTTGTFFVPPWRVVSVLNHSQTADFQGFHF